MKPNIPVKPWYRSKTIWLLVSQLLLIVASMITGETSIQSGSALLLTTVSGFVMRYYTTTGIDVGLNK